MSESLSDKLKSLGLSFGAELAKNNTAQQFTYNIENVMECSELDTMYGKAVYTQQTYPNQHRHGTENLEQPSNLMWLLEWAKAGSSNLEPKDFVFLDAETSGLSGGTGTYAFMIGLGFFTESGFCVNQLFMRDPSQEQAFLAALTHFMGDKKGIVTFNGKSFDVPLLTSRHILNGISTPFKDLVHVDLLPLSRRIWRNRLDNRSLKNLEVELIGFSRAEAEVPGWMVPEIYFDYLKTSDARPLSGVFYHNLNDIVSLAVLFGLTADLLFHPLDTPDIDSLDLIAIARLFEEFGRLELAIEIYEKAINQGLPQQFFIQTIMRYADIFRKQNNWSIATSFWERAAELRHIDAAIELSKYY